MKGKYEGLNNDSRSGKRAKRKKTNIILNSLIGLVILLIIIVSATIFMGGNNEQTVQEDNKKIENKQEKKENNQDSNDKQAKENKDAEQEADEAAAKEDEEDQDRENDSSENEAVVTEGGSGPDVNQTIENPGWEPVGTSQSGEHTAVYDQNSVDWQEMLNAISYATGIDQSNMTVWFLGNNGPNKSVGTVSAKGTQEKYRVYIDWVDGEGWKPVKVEELNS